MTTYFTFQDMNYFLVNYFLVQTDRQTESDAYEPTVQYAQVGSIILVLTLNVKVVFFEMMYIFIVSTFNQMFLAPILPLWFIALCT